MSSKSRLKYKNNEKSISNNRRYNIIRTLHGSLDIVRINGTDSGRKPHWPLGAILASTSGIRDKADQLVIHY